MSLIIKLVTFQMKFWSRTYEDLRPILTLVDPTRDNFLVALNQSNIKYKIKAHNFQTLIDIEKKQNDNTLRDFRAFHDSYHKYEEIDAELQRVTKNS